MELYDCRMAPNPRRARIFIAEKGLDIPCREVDIMAAENLAPAYLAVNPWGTLPALALDDGNVIVEAPCIFRYLETLHPEPNLLGSDPLETARIGAWERFCEMNGMAAVGEFFRNQHEPFAERAMPGYSGVSTLPALVERGRQRVAWFHQQLEQRLDASEFVGSDRFSAADITALCAVDFGKAVGLPVPPTHEATQRWHAMVKARPSAQA
ncbi:MAG: glutathione S-transferase N-terminal domain-containing protein [Gammaproteobacteria bacterium]